MVSQCQFLIFLLLFSYYIIIVNFQFIPVRHQLNVVLVTSIAWTALLSAWYPPVEEGAEGEKKEEEAAAAAKA